LAFGAIAPEISTMQDVGVPGYGANTRFGLFATAAGSAAAIERDNAASRDASLRHRYRHNARKPRL
jgi:hypothetical protein